MCDNRPVVLQPNPIRLHWFGKRQAAWVHQHFVDYIFTQSLVVFRHWKGTRIFFSCSRRTTVRERLWLWLALTKRTVKLRDSGANLAQRPDVRRNANTTDVEPTPTNATADHQPVSSMFVADAIVAEWIAIACDGWIICLFLLRFLVIPFRANLSFLGEWHFGAFVLVLFRFFIITALRTAFVLEHPARLFYHLESILGYFRDPLVCHRRKLTENLPLSKPVYLQSSLHTLFLSLRPNQRQLLLPFFLCCLLDPGLLLAQFLSFFNAVSLFHAL
mmetsp:Transcript_24125/g.47445  ORF Transcript_24125/g.47445 Transcript_24125/m.47445 type:complete len:274 (+) Transcript_24125:325-1146(+)